MLTKTRQLIGAAALASSLAAGGAWAEAHQLNFDSTYTVGDRFHLAGEANSMQEVFTRVDGQTVNEEATYNEARVRANCEVLEVNADGGVTRMAVELVEYEFEVNSEALELEEGKRLIVAVAGDELDYTYEGGGAFDDGYDEALELLLGMPMDKEDNNDTNRLMGATQPREVGETWEMDHAYMAEQAAADGELVIDPEQLQSEVTLVEVEANDAGVPMARIEAALEGTGIDLPAGTLPDFLSVDDSGMRMEITGWLALDEGALYGTQQAEMEMGFIAKGKAPDGSMVEIEAEFEREADVEYSPITE